MAGALAPFTLAPREGRALSSFSTIPCGLSPLCLPHEVFSVFSDGQFMSGLIAELQRDALNPSFPVDSLLRRMKVCAAKLGLPALEVWVDSELNGYRGRKIPKYRELSGQPVAWNPYNGWIPIMMNSAKDQRLISRAPIGQSISSIRDLIDNGDGSNAHYPLSPEIVAILNSGLDFQTPRMVLQIGRSHLVTIIETVRNMSLDWALEMERKGVLGEGMSFEPTERERAQVAMSKSTYHIGSIGSVIGNLGNENTVRDINISSLDARSITETVNKVREAIPQLQTAGVDGAALSRSLDAIDGEVNSAKPDSGKLRALFGDVRSMLVGAAGNVTAEGALALIAAAANLLGS